MNTTVPEGGGRGTGTGEDRILREVTRPEPFQKEEGRAWNWHRRGQDPTRGDQARTVPEGGEEGVGLAPERTRTVPEGGGEGVELAPERTGSYEG